MPKKKGGKRFVVGEGRHRHEMKQSDFSHLRNTIPMDEMSSKKFDEAEAHLKRKDIKFTEGMKQFLIAERAKEVRNQKREQEFQEKLPEIRREQEEHIAKIQKEGWFSDSKVFVRLPERKTTYTYGRRLKQTMTPGKISSANLYMEFDKYNITKVQVRHDDRAFSIHTINPFDGEFETNREEDPVRLITEVRKLHEELDGELPNELTEENLPGLIAVDPEHWGKYLKEHRDKIVEFIKNVEEGKIHIGRGKQTVTPLILGKLKKVYGVQ